MIDNCATVTVLNNRFLFEGQLSAVLNVGIVIVGGNNHHPTHKGTAKLCWKDDNSLVHHVTIEDVLYFLSSLVNVVSVGQLSLQHGDSVLKRDRGT